MTKHKRIAGRSLLAALILAAVLSPFASLAAERIPAMNVHMRIQPDGSVYVQEEIVYDFGEEERHGIFRKIPLIYIPDGSTAERTIEISSISVTDGAGNLRATNYAEGGNIIELRIGDPDITITGEHFYVIRYTLWNAIANYPNGDELYWNAIGTDWSVPIEKARAEVVLPGSLQQDSIAYRCYSGPPQSGGGCETSEIQGPEPGTVAAVRFEREHLNPHEGLTFALAIPPGLVAESSGPRDEISAKGIVRDIFRSVSPASFALPVLVFIVMAVVWWRNGRDPESRAIVPVYEPPKDLSLLECAHLYREHIDGNSVAAAIISLAERGYLTITQVKSEGIIFDSTDHLLTRGKKVDGHTDQAERFILEELFKVERVRLKELKEQLHPLLALVGKTVSDELAARGYYVADPGKVRGTYVAAGIGVMFVGLVFGIATLPLVISGAIILLFGWFMPKLSEAGARKREEIIGFREYLRVAEADRINFTNAPKKDPKTFERFLPYAMIFGVEEEWAALFADLFTEKNSGKWYSGVGQFNAITFTKSMSDLSAATATAMSPHTSSSGGGGFSGGGGGGGGGGSW